MRRAEALFRLGYALHRAGEDETALVRFREAAEAAPGPEDRERAVYWRARVLRGLGREEEARAAAATAAGPAFPSDGYGVMLIEEFGVPARAESGGGRSTATIDSLLAAPGWPEKAAERVRRGLRLARAGDLEAARRELGAVSLEGCPPAVGRVLALAGAVHALYPEGVAWAREAGLAGGVPPEERRSLARLEYPAAYYGEVTRHAAEAGVPARLVWAIMRQESLYDRAAVSRAGARGLLQVMPATLAGMVARGEVPPAGPDALFDPAVNIGVGVRFLAARLEEFGGRTLPALASYNAGEGKCSEWLARAGGDGGAGFVESIGYPETYGYVRKIPWILWKYQTLYPDGGSAPDGNVPR